MEPGEGLPKFQGTAYSQVGTAFPVAPGQQRRRIPLLRTGGASIRLSEWHPQATARLRGNSSLARREAPTGVGGHTENHEIGGSRLGGQGPSCRRQLSLPF